MSVNRTEELARTIISNSIDFWRPRLKMREHDFHLEYCGTDTCLMQVRKGRGGDDPHCVWVCFGKKALDTEAVTTRDLWSGVGHEIAHVLLWPMYFAEVGWDESNLSKVQQNTLMDLQKPRYEECAYTLQKIFEAAYARDYPGDDYLEEKRPQALLAD